ncbi:MAG: Serine/threonine protein kinase, partial [Myxococcaceae bacterium]|nr:Serine/threonine protein kinase [Myxococcaceae bacterium]
MQLLSDHVPKADFDPTVTDRTSPVFRAGEVLAGRYRLERLVGEGGMGIVWEARHVTTEKPVAIKVLKGAEPEAAARFLREAQLAGSLTHRHIVQVFDFWDLPEHGFVFMVMELLRGEPLSARLARGPLSLDETEAFMVPVVAAVRSAHAQGVIHRDLKPENIFLARDTDDAIEVKVLDFGLAKVLVHDTEATALTQTGSVMGTPYYMAPERVYGEKDVDVSADVWALGVILHECLAGKRPFDGGNYGQIFRAITMGTIPSLRDLVPHVPPAIDALVKRMLSRDRAGRPTDLGEVLATLRCALAHDQLVRAATTPISIPPPQPTLLLAPRVWTPPHVEAPLGTVLNAATSVRAAPLAPWPRARLALLAV